MLLNSRTIYLEPPLEDFTAVVIPSDILLNPVTTVKK